VPWLALAFLCTAALYASVGFGGGSTYTALLVLADTDYRLIPIVSLSCNLVVVTGGSIAFARRGWLDRDLAIPLALASVPMAWLGGATTIERESFLLILGGALVAAGGLLVTRGAPVIDVDGPRPSRTRLWTLGPLAGGGLGYLAGLVGIGGGIFLAPALHLLRVAPPKTVASTASVFILVNSLAGLAGQWFKLSGAADTAGALGHGWLLVAVLIGGQAGSRAGIHLLSGGLLRRLTGTLVLFVGLRLLWTAWSA